MSVVVMVGTFPPPVHGMAVVNANVRDQLAARGVDPVTINLSAHTLDRSIAARLSRLPKVLRGLMRVALIPGAKDAALYLSVSGGMGQIYDLLFVGLARLRGMRLILHHHSFAYLSSRRALARCLIVSAGGSAVHLVQSPMMAQKLVHLYGGRRTVAVSNAVFFCNADGLLCRDRKHLVTVGYISNISAEKGVFEFLDLLAAAEKAGLGVRGLLAGPFQDERTERQVRARLSELGAVDYLGALYGSKKDAFFDEVDVLVFPTHYRNETEGIVNHEAMRRGVPVIAYGRGCIPEIVLAGAGLVVDPGDDFVCAALIQLQRWIDHPRIYRAACRSAAEQFLNTYHASADRWFVILDEIVG